MTESHDPRYDRRFQRGTHADAPASPSSESAVASDPRHDARFQRGASAGAPLPIVVPPHLAATAAPPAPAPAAPPAAPDASPSDVLDASEAPVTEHPARWSHAVDEDAAPGRDPFRIGLLVGGIVLVVAGVVIEIGVFTTWGAYYSGYDVGLQILQGFAGPTGPALLASGIIALAAWAALGTRRR